MDKGKIDLFRFGVILRLLSEKNEERGSCFSRTSGDYLPGPGGDSGDTGTAEDRKAICSPNVEPNEDRSNTDN